MLRALSVSNLRSSPHRALRGRFVTEETCAPWYNWRTIRVSESGYEREHIREQPQRPPCCERACVGQRRSERRIRVFCPSFARCDDGDAPTCASGKRHAAKIADGSPSCALRSRKGVRVRRPCEAGRRGAGSFVWFEAPSAQSGWHRRGRAGRLSSRCVRGRGRVLHRALHAELHCRRRRRVAHVLFGGAGAARRGDRRLRAFDRGAGLRAVPFRLRCGHVLRRICRGGRHAGRYEPVGVAF